MPAGREPHNRKFMSFTGRKVLMAAARSGIFSFPPWMVAFFVRASTGHIGIFSLVMAITSDKSGDLYEEHHAHRYLIVHIRAVMFCRTYSLYIWVSLALIMFLDHRQPCSRSGCSRLAVVVIPRRAELACCCPPEISRDNNRSENVSQPTTSPHRSVTIGTWLSLDQRCHQQGGGGGFTIGGTVSITAVPGALLPSRADIKTESIMRSWGEAAIQHQRLLPPPIYHPTLPRQRQLRPHLHHHHGHLHLHDHDHQRHHHDHQCEMVIYH